MRIEINGITVPRQYEDENLFTIRLSFTAGNRASVKLVDIHQLFPDIEGLPIQIFGDDKLLFGGIITGKDDIEQDFERFFTLTCEGWESEINRRHVIYVYSAKTLTYIVNHIFNNFVETGADYSFDLDDTGNNIRKLRFENKVMDALNTLANISGTYLWMTNDKVLKMKKDFPDSGITITDSTRDIFDFNPNIDITELVSKLLFRGGNALSTSRWSDDFSGDGVTKQWKLSYQYNDLKAYLNGIEKTVGILHLHDPSDYDFLADFNQQVITACPSVGVPAASDTLEFNYFYYYPLTFDYVDDGIKSRIAALTGGEGIIEQRIEKKLVSEISNLRDAYLWCESYLAKKNNADVSITFSTYNPDYNCLGSMIHIDRAGQKFNGLVAGMTIKSEPGGHILYTPEIMSKLISVEDLLQDLLKQNVSDEAFEGSVAKSFSFKEKVDSSEVIVIEKHSNNDYLIVDEGAINVNTFAA